MPSSVVRVVTADHDRLARLLRRMCAPGPNRERWRKELSGLLHAHRLAERAHLYPAVLAQAPPLQDAVRHSAACDVAVDQLLADLAQAEVDRPGHNDLCERASALLTDHATRVSSTILRPLVEHLPRRELRRLGGEFEQRRESELMAVVDHEPPPRRLDLSRAELYEMARRAGIEGRSSMSRAELIDELRRRDS
jgi:hypothetical protein